MIIAFQSSIDRQIDRVRARKRARLVKLYMARKDFDAAKLYILTMITGSMQNFSAAEQEELGKKVGEIEVGKTNNREKGYALGFVFLNKMGEIGLKELFDNTDDEYATGGTLPTTKSAHTIPSATSPLVATQPKSTVETVTSLSTAADTSPQQTRSASRIEQTSL